MLNTTLSSSVQSNPSPRTQTRSFAIFLLAVWFAVAFWLDARETFATPPGTPPLPLLLAVAAPVIIFLCIYWSSRAFRDFIVTADLRLLCGMQSWRFAGFGFIALNRLGLLPGYFAWPAALGDMAVAVTAPWIVIALMQTPGFASSKTFVAWNMFGIFDFLVLAIGTGTVAPLLFHNLTQTSEMIAAAPMRHLPLVLIPTFFVPTLMIFHIVALIQARHTATREK